tara:strand:- start:116 stop:433 length:318 start_codon:yes stop_codon:yes gene_type:complete
MGTLHILECDQAARADNDAIPLMHFNSDDGMRNQQLATSGASASTALDQSTAYVTLIASEDMYINLGGSAVEADTTDFLLPATTPFSFKVSHGDNQAYIAAEDVA